MYFVQWTVGAPSHWPNFDLIIGEWGERASADDRVLVALRYHAETQGGGFMVVDSGDRPAAASELYGAALRRDDVIGQDIATRAFDIVDAIWMQDPRIDEIRGYAREA